MKCKYCKTEMDVIALEDESGKPLDVAEYECPNCGGYYDCNGDWIKEGDEE